MTVPFTASLLVPPDYKQSPVHLVPFCGTAALFAGDVDWSAQTAFAPFAIVDETRYIIGTSGTVDSAAVGEQSNTSSVLVSAARQAARRLPLVVFATCRGYRSGQPHRVEGELRRKQPTATRPTPADDPPETTADTGTRASKIEADIERLFASGAACEFEDGMPNPFSAGLLATIRAHGTSAMEIVAYLVFYNKVHRRVASEALHWLGWMKDAATLTYRRWLLETSLSSVSPVVRDGAVLGLAYMNDPHCVPYLVAAAKREPIAHLRRDMSRLLGLLEPAGQQETDAHVPEGGK